MSPSIHIVPHATDLGISAAIAASILAVMGLAGIPGGILLGGIADKIGNRKVLYHMLHFDGNRFVWPRPCERSVVVVYPRGTGELSEAAEEGRVNRRS